MSKPTFIQRLMAGLCLSGHAKRCGDLSMQDVIDVLLVLDRVGMDEVPSHIRRSLESFLAERNIRVTEYGAEWVPLSGREAE